VRLRVTLTSSHISACVLLNSDRIFFAVSSIGFLESQANPQKISKTCRRLIDPRSIACVLTDQMPAQPTVQLPPVPTQVHCKGCNRKQYVRNSHSNHKQQGLLVSLQTTEQTAEAEHTTMTLQNRRILSLRGITSHLSDPWMNK